MFNCVLAGVGGQGTVLASKVISLAALEKGYQVKSTETIGMAQKGGSVVSFIRIGKEIWSPIIAHGQADVILGLNTVEAFRYVEYLKKDGVIIIGNNGIDMKAVLELCEIHNENKDNIFSKNSIKVVDTKSICEKCNSNRVINMALMGAAIKYKFPEITPRDLENELMKIGKKKYYDINRQAIHLGSDQLKQVI